MKTTENYLAEIKEIRKMMEESSRFLSLSGLSGILIGIYALAASFITYQALFPDGSLKISSEDKVIYLTLFALLILILPLVTVILLTHKKAKKAGKKIWNKGSRLMLLNLSIPLATGGIFILILIFRGIYEMVSPACLIFYGLALVNAAKFTRQEIFCMGLIQLSLGILAAIFPLYGLILWALGFGAIHIVYGTVMYLRYEHKTNK